MTAASQRSDSWRNTTIGALIALVGGLSLLNTGIGDPVRAVVSFLTVAIVVILVVSFVMAAFTSARFRRAVSIQQYGRPPQPKAAISRHDRIVYIIAFGSAAAVGVAYFGSWRSVPWAWPAFVSVYSIVVGIVLLTRRGRN